MDVTVAEAKDRLPELISAMEGGEAVVITRLGKPVAQIAPPPPERRQVRFGTLRGKIHLKLGWDKPLSEEEFLSGDF